MKSSPFAQELEPTGPVAAARQNPLLKRLRGEVALGDIPEVLNVDTMHNRVLVLFDWNLISEGPGKSQERRKKWEKWLGAVLAPIHAKAEEVIVASFTKERASPGVLWAGPSSKADLIPSPVPLAGVFSTLPEKRTGLAKAVEHLRESVYLESSGRAERRLALFRNAVEDAACHVLIAMGYEADDVEEFRREMKFKGGDGSRGVDSTSTSSSHS